MIDAEIARDRWRALALTGAAVTLSLMTWFSATAILPDLSAYYALTVSQAAWLTNAVQIGFAVGALAASIVGVSDSLPTTRLMAVSAALAAIANVSLLVAPDAWTLLAARIATGVALAGVYPPAMKFIATWFVTGRGLAMGAMVGALTLGSAMPHLFRAADAALAWQAVVVICSLGGFAASVIFGWVIQEGPHPFSRSAVDIRRVGAILRNRPVMLANLGYFGHMWELYAMWGWFLAYAAGAQAQGVGLANASGLTFAVIASGSLGCLSGGWLADRIGRCHAAMLMMALSGMSALLIGFFFSGPLWAFVLIALIWGFSVVADSAQFSAAVSELADSNSVGSSLALQMGVGFAITILAIWLMPLLAAALGSWRWTFLALVPGPVVGLLAMATLRRCPEASTMASGKR